MKKGGGGVKKEGGRVKEEGKAKERGGRWIVRHKRTRKSPAVVFLVLLILLVLALFFPPLSLLLLVAFLVFFFSVFPPACAFGLVHTGRFCWRGNVLWLVFANAVPRFRPHGFMLSHTAFLCGFNSGDLAIWHLWQHVSKHPSEI